jgi:hypothetical protein
VFYALDLLSDVGHLVFGQDGWANEKAGQVKLEAFGFR